MYHRLHDPDQISRGGPFLPGKWILGDHFSTENFGPGDQNFQDQNSGDRSQTAVILAIIIYCAIALPPARVVVDDITNEMPRQDSH